MAGDPKETEKTYLQTIAGLQERIREQDALIEQLKRQVRDGIFLNKNEIMSVYDWSEYNFSQWVKMGLPCRIINRTHIAHRDNINDFFKTFTRVSYKGASDDVIESGSNGST